MEAADQYADRSNSIRICWEWDSYMDWSINIQSFIKDYLFQSSANAT